MNKTSLGTRVRGSTSLGDEVPKVLPTSTDDVAMILVLHDDNLSDFLGYSCRDSKDSLLGSGDRLLGTSERY